MVRPWILILTAPLLAGACNDQPPLLAPDNAVLAGVGLRLSVSVWRDFISPSCPDRLQVLVQLIAPDSIAVPASVTADSAWVVNGSERWATALSEELPRPLGYASFGACGQQQFPNGTIADVYVAVRDGARRLLLEAPRQQIMGVI